MSSVTGNDNDSIQSVAAQTGASDSLMGLPKSLTETLIHEALSPSKP